VVNDYLYVVGGIDTTSTATNTVYYYDLLLGGAWTATAGTLPSAVASFGGNLATYDTTVNPSRSGIVVAGGSTTTAIATNSVYAAEHS
jgi:hypothetical protein